MTQGSMGDPTFLILTALAAGSQHGYGIMTDVAQISDGSGCARDAVCRLEPACGRVDREEIVDTRLGNGQQTACQPYPGGGFRTSANQALLNSVFPLPGVNIRPSALPSGTGVLLAFSQSLKHGVPFIAIEVAVVQASQQCTGS